MLRFPPPRLYSFHESLWRKSYCPRCGKVNIKAILMRKVPLWWCFPPFIGAYLDSQKTTEEAAMTYAGNRQRCFTGEGDTHTNPPQPRPLAANGVAYRVEYRYTPVRVRCRPKSPRLLELEAFFHRMCGPESEFLKKLACRSRRDQEARLREQHKGRWYHRGGGHYWPNKEG